MLIIARTLAVLSVLLTLVAIEIVHVQYLPIGFEATGVFGGYSFVLATMTAVSALVIVKVRARSGKRAGSSSTVLLSGISLLALAALILLGSLHPWPPLGHPIFLRLPYLPKGAKGGQGTWSTIVVVNLTKTPLRGPQSRAAFLPDLTTAKALPPPVAGRQWVARGAKGSQSEFCAIGAGWSRRDRDEGAICLLRVSPVQDRHPPTQFQRGQSHRRPLVR